VLGLGLSFARQTAKVFSYVKDSLKAYFRFYDTTPDFLLDGSTSFDGTNDYISIADANNLSFGDSSTDSAFTISAWVKMDDATGFAIASKGVYNTDGEWNIVSGGDDKIYFMLMDESVADTYERIVTDSTVTSYENKWTHITGTYDGTGGTSANGGLKLYIDGSLVATTAQDNGTYVAMENLGGNVHIGRSDSSYANGSIANVGIWNRALSASEIESIYWRGSYSELKDTELTNLVSWYDLDSTSLGSELITNGDNESAKAGLSDIRASSSQSNEQAQSGTYSYKVVANSATDTHYSRVSLTANKSHKVTGYAYLPSGQTISSLKVGYDNSGDNQFLKYTISTTNSWVAFEVDVPANASYSYFTIGGASGSYENNYWYIDSISVKEVQAEDKQGSNEGSIIGATTNSDSYSGESPFKPRIQDKAAPKMAVQLADGSTSFDGTDDYISIGGSSSNSDFDFGTGNVTVSFWVYQNSLSNYHVFVQSYQGGANSGDWRIYSDANGVIGSNGWGAGESGNGTLVVGKWQHIASVRSGSTSNIYVDGSLVKTASNSNDVDTNYDIEIGRGYVSSLHYTSMKMANLAIYKGTALTQTQVQELMFTEKYSGLSSDLKTNLVSWYDLGARVQTGSDVVYDETNATLGDELIVNGDFSSALGSEWDLTLGGGGGSISLVSNQLKMLQGGSSSSLYASQDFTTEVGATYQFTVDLVSSSGTTWIKLLAGTSQNGSQVKSSGYSYVTAGATNALSFVATATTTWIAIQESQGAGSNSVWDNVSVKKVSGNAGIVYGATTTTGYTSSPHGVVDPLNYGEVYSGRALSFDGSNDYVSCGVSDIPSGNSARTMMLWVKQDQATGSNEGIFGFGETGGSEASETFEFYNDNSGIRVHYASGSSGGTTNLGQSVWRHLCATHDGSTVSIYIDGVLDHTDSKTLSTVADFCRIGANSYDSSPGEYFDGSISNIKVFNIALTQSQIQELYSNPEQQLATGVSSSNLKLDLPMQEGSGSTVYDGSGNGNHGTITGATWATGESDGYQSSLVRSNTPMIFDGSDDYVAVSDNSTLDFGTSDFSVSGWFKWERGSASDDSVGGIQKFDGSTGWYFRPTTGNNWYQVTHDGSESAGAIDMTGWDDGQWHHIVGVWDRSSTFSAYLDGVKSSSTVDITGSDGSGINNATALDIGGASGTWATDYFPGIINEVAIWDVALDADAVTALYGSGTPLLPTSDSGNYDNSGDLQGYWRNDGIATWTDRTPLGVYGSELLTNGDFSSFSSGQATSWTTTGSPTLSEETTIVQSGSSQKIFMGSSGNNGIDQAVTTVAGKKYQFSAKVYVTGGRARIIFDNGSDDGQTYVGTGGSTGYEALNTWHTITHIKTAQSTSVTARIWTSSANTTVYVDDVSIKRYRGGNDGTASGSPVSIVIPEGSTSGRDNQGFLLSDTTSISNGIRLHGSGEYVSIQDSEVLSFGDGTDDKPLTFEAWVKMDDATDFIIFSKGIYNTNYEYFFGTFSSDKFGLELYDEDVDSTYERAYTSSALTSYEGQWVHLCATYDGRGGTSANAGISLYVNGVSQSVTLDDAGTYVSMVNGGADLHIGRYNTSYKKGLIDEIRIYHKVLSASEVLKNYNNGKSAHQ